MGSQKSDLTVGDLVEVVWDDAFFITDGDPQALRDDGTTRTVGWVVRMGERGLFLSSEKLEGYESGWRAITRLPWRIIRSTRQL